MEYLFSNLAKILKKQNQTLSELLDAAMEHNLALRKNDTVAVLATAFKQEELSRKLKEQDKKREETQRKLASQCGLGEQPTLNMLLTHASKTTARDLSELSHSLKESLQQVGEIKNLNNILARRGQIMTEQLIRMLRPKSGSTYMGSGKIKNRDKLLTLVDRTI
jgi:flagellar biosynthesis/type III secretory pathway chaperone